MTTYASLILGGKEREERKMGWLSVVLGGFSKFAGES